ncbi:MAG: dihydrodipicolinate reductase C-terminal domain-containing protein [Bauldia sp.]
MTIRVVVAGATGWTGSELVKAIAKADDLMLAAGVARKGEGMVPTLEAALAAPSDVVVDYTHPGVVKAHTLLALSKGRHVVIGTSGLTAGDYREIDAAAKKAGKGVIAAGNYSITATLLTRFAVEAAKYIPDVEVIDYASAKKPDVPSGTTQELAERIAAVRGKGSSVPVGDILGPKEARGAAIGEGKPVQLHSLRLPSYVIAVEAIFGAPDERLTIRHDAGSSAAPYVAGTLLAVRKVVGLVGLTRGLDTLI